MRILHVLDHSIPLHSGYAFRTLSILQQQRAFGWETAHVTSPKHYLVTPPKENVEGWDFFRTPAVPKFLSRIGGVAELALVRLLCKRIGDAIVAERPDIVHAHSPALNGLAALWACRRFGLPLVYEVRAFWEDAAASHGSSSIGSWRYRATRSMETYVLRHADRVTTICEGLRGEILGRGLAEAKVVVIPNAVDTAAFNGAAPPEPALLEQYGLRGKTVLGFFGSFYHYEGLEVLLRALPRILGEAPDVRVLLAGGGNEEAALRGLAEELHVAGNVMFIGRIAQKEIHKYYDLADIFIFPRRSSRLTELVTPLKPLEAMAQEKIVLASSVGGHRELIRDGVTGHLFAPDDPIALADAVLRALAQREQWPSFRARGREYVDIERNWARSVERYKPLYQALTSSSRR